MPIVDRVAVPGRPTVAIVVPVFNAAEFIAATIASIQAQSFRGWRCVVVDDGSTDATTDVARSAAAGDPRITFLRQSNLGTPTARNNGLAALGPDIPYVAYLDGDDVWLPGALAALVAALDSEPAAVGVYGLAEYIDDRGRPMRVGMHPTRQRDRRRMGRFDLTGLAPDEPYTWSAMIVSGTLWPSGVALHRREVIEQVGGFEPSLRQLQDWDLYIRMARKGNFVPIDRQVIWYRQHGSNVTSRTERVAFYTLKVRLNAWLSSAGPERRELRRIWRRLTARWSVRALQSAIREARARDGVATTKAVAAVPSFVRMFVVGHPVAPSPRAAHLLATQVMDGPPIAS